MARALDLTADKDVTWAEGRWLAASSSPWLRAPGLERWRGRWLRLRYHAGLFDEHVRPLIRFRRSAGPDVTVPMNGALQGVGQWIGRVPDGTMEVAFSPVRRPGAFSFALDDARPMGVARLFTRGMLTDPKLALTACGARVIGARAEAEHCLSFAALSTPMRNYAHWLAARVRPIDLNGFDRPPSNWNQGPHVHVVGSPSTDQRAWRRTLDSLDAQSYPHWRFGCLATSSFADTPVLDPAAPTASLGPANDLVVAVRAGDLFHPHALALVVEHMVADPAFAACYGDEDSEDEAGRPMSPRLRPAPEMIAGLASVGEGDGLFWRIGGAPDYLGALAGSAAPFGRTGHIRRLLFRRPVPSAPAPPVRPVSERETVTVIIPTRDRAELLAACLAGLFEGTDHPAVEIVLVDNGTSDPAALAVLAEAELRPTVRVIRAPGRFNFSALCNAGAAQATGAQLLFLNNDVTPLRPDWLLRMSAWARKPEVGAVGARLVYPNGRLQHGGVVVGLGGTALHGHHRAGGKDEGYLRQLERTRSVAAVTGAVLLVERRKFAAVGGFDADCFPVLLNDIDLCLRLNKRGWQTIYEPAATLVHAESASRGRSARPFTLYGRERDAFARRWPDMIRDDPHFHPALSLASLEPALG